MRNVDEIRPGLGYQVIKMSYFILSNLSILSEKSSAET